MTPDSVEDQSVGLFDLNSYLIVPSGVRGARLFVSKNASKLASTERGGYHQDHCEVMRMNLEQKQQEARRQYSCQRVGGRK